MVRTGQDAKLRIEAEAEEEEEAEAEWKKVGTASRPKDEIPTSLGHDFCKSTTYGSGLISCI